MEKYGINEKHIIRSVCVFLIFNYFTYFIVFLLSNFGISFENITNAEQVLLSTGFSFLIALILFLIYRKDLIEDFKKFINNFIKNIDCGFKCWFVGLIIMMVSNLLLNIVFKAGGANNEQAVQNLLKALPHVMAIDVCLLAPFNEEIAFRKTVKDVFKNKWVFVILSFLLFGGAHVVSSAQNLLDYLYIIPYGALGGAFAYAYYETDTIFTSMFMHFIHNTILVALSLLVL